MTTHKVVPREPTPEMLGAALQTMAAIDPWGVPDIWRAMYDAAPTESAPAVRAALEELVQDLRRLAPGATHGTLDISNVLTDAADALQSPGVSEREKARAEGFAEAINKAASLAYNWTSKPPREDGNRALMATAIRNLRPDAAPMKEEGRG